MQPLEHASCNELVLIFVRMVGKTTLPIKKFPVFRASTSFVAFPSYLLNRLIDKRLIVAHLLLLFLLMRPLVRRWTCSSWCWWGFIVVLAASSSVRRRRWTPSAPARRSSSRTRRPTAVISTSRCPTNTSRSRRSVVILYDTDIDGNEYENGKNVSGRKMYLKNPSSSITFTTLYIEALNFFPL